MSVPRLRILEVAALPFPSRQGTQVMLHALCDGLAGRGHDVHLLTYAHGAFDLVPRYTLHRLRDFPRFRSLRSGPSWRRAALDLSLAAEIRRLAGKLSPDVLHVHNVEAAAAALLVPPRPRLPCVFHSHNVMEDELPTYVEPLLRGPARAFGRWLDRALPRHADLTLAVSDATRGALIRAGGDPARIVTTEPGIDLADVASVAAPVPSDPRPATRDPRPVIGHVGNLDAYQGLDLVVQALARLRPCGVDPELVLITESDPSPVLSMAARAGVRARSVAHGPPEYALRALAACDAAVVARTVRGGFPIKLAVLLAAGVPVVATPAAAGGLGIDDVAHVAGDASPEALARAIRAALADPGRAERAERGRRMARDRWSAQAAAARVERELIRVAGHS